MTTTKLTQALIAQKVANAETNLIDVISRALEIPVETLHRVFYAQSLLPLNPGCLNWEVLLPDNELREAIRKAMEDGQRRVAVASAIRNGRTLTVRTDSILAEKDIGKLCNGCPERLECTAEKLYEPYQCYHERKTHLTVYPLRMTATELEIEASQPAGKFIVPLKNITIR